MNNNSQILKKSKMKLVTAACDKCRVLKVKCIRSAEEGPCVKCTKSGSQCVVSKMRRLAKANQRAKPQVFSESDDFNRRIADLEGKLNGILDLLSRSNAAANAETSFTSRPELPINDHLTSFQGLSQDATDSPDGEELSNPYLIRNMEFNAHTSASETFPTTGNSWFTKLELRPAVLDQLLNDFRKMQSYCPFVMIRNEWTSRSMASERPFLLLAAIISASSRYPQLQRALTIEFKEILANRIIISEDRSLDLLQGLLVHLTWFQFHLIPRSQQIYRYLQIAISVLIDLGLDQNLDNVLEERTDLLLCDPSLRSKNAGSIDLFGNEGRRATLGCYYLSTIISFFSGKPNNLPFTQYMLECAIILQQSPEFETDHLIYHLVKLQRVVEEARDLYRIDKTTDSCARVHSHAERLKVNLEEWRHALPASFRHSVSLKAFRSPLIETRYYAANINIYEMGLVHRFETLRPLARNKDEKGHAAPPPHPTLIMNLIKCVDSVKKYLDCFLTIPTSEYHRLPLEEWFRVIMACFVLYKLSLGLSEVPGWNVHIARETADLEDYLSLLLNRLKLTQPTQIPLSATCTDDLFSIFPIILENVKDSYIVARDSPSLFSDGIIAHDDLGTQKSTQTFSSPSFSSDPANGRARCPGISSLYLPATPTHSSMSTSIAAEIQTIESEKLWNDLMMDDSMEYLFNNSQLVHH
ncbi:hypothetical protein F5884DRAFT_847183 [Xylogone sp. PMI_703]|nr:hypothetical protein F5884DRAFT_847183 [Xylogone sp. PMI_703]